MAEKQTLAEVQKQQAQKNLARKLVGTLIIIELDGHVETRLINSADTPFAKSIRTCFIDDFGSYINEKDETKRFHILGSDNKAFIPPSYIVNPKEITDNMP